MSQGIVCDQRQRSLEIFLGLKIAHSKQVLLSDQKYVLGLLKDLIMVASM